MMLTHDDWVKINHVLFSVYSSEDQEQLRRTVLEKLHELFSFDLSFFDLYNKDQSPSYFDPISLDMTKKDLDDYYSIQINCDYVAFKISHNKESLVYRDSDLMSLKVRDTSTIYNKWIKPMGVYYSCGVIFVHQQITYGSLTLFNSKENGDFTDKELYILEKLTTHIALRFFQLFPLGNKNVSSFSFSTFRKKVHLTEREEEICRWLTTDYSIREISAFLYISENTTRRHISNIYCKAKVSSRLQLLSLITSFEEKHQILS